MYAAVYLIPTTDSFADYLGNVTMRYLMDKSGVLPDAFFSLQCAPHGGLQDREW